VRAKASLAPASRQPRRTIWLIGLTAGVVGALTCLLAGALPASAGTSQPAAGNAGARIQQAQTGILRLPNGMVVSVKHLRSTSPELPQLPRGVQYAPEVTAVTVLHAVSDSPYNASGCTPRFGATTCIYVNGSGLKVVYWTTAVSLKSGKTYPTAYYEVNGKVEEYDAFEVESNGGLWTDPIGWDYTYEFYIAGHPAPYYFSSNVEVCNFWTGAAINSLPCESVHR
jgi:hypothetical protein